MAAGVEMTEKRKKESYRRDRRQSTVKTANRADLP
jgi:hypothetical protein